MKNQNKIKNKSKVEYVKVQLSIENINFVKDSGISFAKLINSLIDDIRLK